LQNKLYWIKLYIEVLDDFKMCELDSDTWRHAIELFLIAGEHNQAGALPSIHYMAWKLRMSQEEILAALTTLEQLGITSRDENGNWIVTHFARRQASFSGADRSRLYRQRYADRDDDDEIHRDLPVAQPRDESAPDTHTDTESDKDSDTDCVSDSHTPVGDEHTPGQAYFARAFKTQPTPTQLLNLAQLEKTHGYTRLSQVIDWAISSGIPPGRALRAIHTAIKTWSEAPPPNRRAANPHRTGALEKLRKELSGDFDT